MKNQIIGVKFLHSSDYKELLNVPSPLSLTAGKTYAYISAGFDVNLNDLVIIPNSGYNDTPLVPAVVTVLDYRAGLEFATKSILAVIPFGKLEENEIRSLEVYQLLAKRQNIFKQLEQDYDEAIKIKKFRKLANKDPHIAQLLGELDKLDEFIEDTDELPKIFTDYTEKENDEDDSDD